RATTRSRRRWLSSCTSARPGSMRRCSRCSRRARPMRRRRCSRRPPLRSGSAPRSCSPRPRPPSRARAQGAGAVPQVPLRNVRDTGRVRVLVVDDEEAVRSALTHALRRDGYEVSTVADGTTALATLLRNRHEAIVLDVLMPEPGGLEVCRAIRARGDDTPILMVTAGAVVSDRVAGLDAGADDYLAKPFALEELRARLRALLRRSGAGAELLRFADVELDLAAHQASRRGEGLPLTKTEFAL